MPKEKFVMRDGSGNYAKDIAVYVSDFHNAKIFYEDPKDFEKYGNDIIILESEKGLALLAEEIELLDTNLIPVAESRLNELTKGRNKLHEATPLLEKYVKEYNKRNFLFTGIINGEIKQRIIEGIILEHKKQI